MKTFVAEVDQSIVSHGIRYSILWTRGKKVCFGIEAAGDPKPGDVLEVSEDATRKDLHFLLRRA